MEPDVLEGAYDCAVCWQSCRNHLKNHKRVMTCVRCPAVRKVCAACYERLPNKSCIQCTGPMSEYQSHRCEASCDSVIDVDAISAAPQDASCGENAADVFDGRDVSQANLGRIRASYASHGFVCVRMLTQEQCNELVLEQWRRVILCQEWTDEYKIVVHGEDGRVLDPDRPNDQSEFLAAVVGPLSAARRKQFEAGWPLHRGFGACCDPAVFHLESVWKIRQDPDLYKIASDICNEAHLWTTLDRSIQKLPGQGDNEFLNPKP